MVQAHSYVIEYALIALLRGSEGTSPILDQGWSPVVVNGFREFLRAKMSSQDMQLNTINCIFLPKSKLISYKPYTCSTKLYAHEHLRTRRYASVYYILNSFQKFCCNGFSQILLLYVILGPTLLWESSSCRPPPISPAGCVHVQAPGKALIGKIHEIEKCVHWDTTPPHMLWE